MDNYKIIANDGILHGFIKWLPDLTEDECYYVCLFARSKYAKDENGINKFPHIKSDKSQLKRLTVSNKNDLPNKLRQLEVAVGSYKTKSGFPIPQEALVPYINPNPRSQKRAMYTCMRRFVDILQCRGTGFNIHQEAMSAIQKSCSRKFVLDFDIDRDKAVPYIFEKMHEFKINLDAVHILATRGGAHLMVELDKILPEFKKTWYNSIVNTIEVDIRGDNMIPIPGCIQGGFIPQFM